MNSFIIVRNKINGSIYRNLIKKILFQIDPERVHNSFIKIGRFLGSNIITKSITSSAFNYSNRVLEQKILGIKFKNPVGLSAGFDKNAEIISIVSDVGFGFAEVGSITAKPSNGNEGKRLWRVPERKSIRVNLGLNNKGAMEILRNFKGKKFNIPFGISIAKTNCKETNIAEEGLKDYLFSLNKLKDLGMALVDFGRGTKDVDKDWAAITLSNLG